MKLSTEDTDMLVAAAENYQLSQKQLQGIVPTASRRRLRSLRDRGLLASSNKGWNITLTGLGLIVYTKHPVIDPKLVDIQLPLSRTEDLALYAIDCSMAPITFVWLSKLTRIARSTVIDVSRRLESKGLVSITRSPSGVFVVGVTIAGVAQVALSLYEQALL